jgi:hypothetical protein
MPGAQSHAPAIRSRMELWTQEPSLIIQPSLTSQNSAAITREAPLPAMDGAPVRDESNPKPPIRPESLPRPQPNVPSPWPEAAPTGYVMLRYSGLENAENNHLRAAAG